MKLAYIVLTVVVTMGIITGLTTGTTMAVTTMAVTTMAVTIIAETIETTTKETKHRGLSLVQALQAPIVAAAEIKERIVRLVVRNSIEYNRMERFPVNLTRNQFVDVWYALHDRIEELERQMVHADTDEEERTLDNIQRHLFNIKGFLRRVAREQGHRDLVANRRSPPASPVTPAAANANARNEASGTFGELPGSSTNSNRRNQNNSNRRNRNNNNNNNTNHGNVNQTPYIRVDLTADQIDRIVDAIGASINYFSREIFSLEMENNPANEEEIQNLQMERARIMELVEYLERALPAVPAVQVNIRQNASRANALRNALRNAPRNAPRNEASRAVASSGPSTTNTRRRRGRKNRKTRRS
jgi:hypothetical protein